MKTTKLDIVFAIIGLIAAIWSFVIPGDFILLYVGIALLLYCLVKYLRFRVKLRKEEINK